MSEGGANRSSFLATFLSMSIGKSRKHFVVRQLNPMCLHVGCINAIVDVFPIFPVVACII